MLFDGAFHKQWGPDEKRISIFVFIGKNLDHDAIKASTPRRFSTLLSLSLSLSFFLSLSLSLSVSLPLFLKSLYTDIYFIKMGVGGIDGNDLYMFACCFQASFEDIKAGELRFKIGDRVQANVGQFTNGTITKLWDDGNPYRISLDNGTEVRSDKTQPTTHFRMPHKVGEGEGDGGNFRLLPMYT